MSIIPALQWRYATKKMNGEKVSQDKVNSILEAARLAPTSSGLQPFEMIVITNQALKEKIKTVAFNQSQLTDCSHLIVLYGTYKTRGSKNIQEYILANQSTNWFTVGLSVMATQASAITFLSTPGQAYHDGMGFVQFYFGLPLAMVVWEVMV